MVNVLVGLTEKLEIVGSLVAAGGDTSVSSPNPIDFKEAGFFAACGCWLVLGCYVTLVTGFVSVVVVVLLFSDYFFLIFCEDIMTTRRAAPDYLAGVVAVCSSLYR